MWDAPIEPSKKAAWQEERRKHAWELQHQGWKQKDIAATVGVSEGTVSEWLKRGREQGVGALNARPHAGGAPPRLSSEQLTHIPEILAKGAQAYGFHGDGWTANRLAVVIKRVFGVSYHRVHVARLMRMNGWGRSPLYLASHPVWNEMPEHFVQFYTSDDFLLDALRRFLEAGLSTGAACLVIATQTHRQRLGQILQASGLDLLLRQAEKKLVVMDAAETLAQFMVGGRVNPVRFFKVVGELIAQVGEGQPFMHIFGEMVALLWMEGKRTEAIALEALWNELHKTSRPFSLFCAYPQHFFTGEADKKAFNQICQHHSHAFALPQL